MNRAIELRLFDHRNLADIEQKFAKEKHMHDAFGFVWIKYYNGIPQKRFRLIHYTHDI